MEFLQPETWAEALQMKAAHPQAVPIQGGTDVMVELNFDRYRPEYLLDLTRVSELAQWAPDNGHIRLGAGVSYTRVIEDLGDRLPGLAQASRTVGSPQIRNRGTVGGNLGAASPAGDSHPPLPAGDFYTGVKKSALAPDELIRAFWMAPATGPQHFSKIGTRNAMVIAVCSFAVALDTGERRVGTGIGSAAPTPLRATAAEEFLARELHWDGALDEAVAREFGELVAAAAAPI